MPKRFVEVENPQALIDSFDAFSDDAMESILRQAAIAGAREFFFETKLRAPVDKGIYEGKQGKHPPGFLRDHIIIAYDDEVSVPGRIASYLVTWSKEAFYGYFLEFGTSNMAAQPFLRPAFEAKKRASVRAAEAVFEAKVKELSHGK